MRSSYILHYEVALLCFHVGKICTQSDLILFHTSNSLHEQRSMQDKCMGRAVSTARRPRKSYLL